MSARVPSLVIVLPLLPLGASPPFLGPPFRGAAQDAPSFAVPEGTELRRTATEVTRWELEEMIQRVGGNVVENEAPPMTATVERRVAAFDEYRAVRDGMPAELHRTLEEFTVEAESQMESEGATLDFAAGLGSEILDRAVVFERGEGDGELSVRFEDGEGGTDLEHLVEDMDLRSLLPPEDTAEGEEWGAEDEALRPLFAAGGTPPLEITRLDGTWRGVLPSDVVALALTNLGDSTRELEGQAWLSWTAVEDDEGRKLARIELSFEAEAGATLGDELAELTDSVVEGSPRRDLGLSVAWEVEGEGEILWDLAAGRYRTYTVSAEFSVDATMTWRQVIGGSSVECEGEYELTGSTRLEGSAE